jgi:hypothetical protein
LPKHEPCKKGLKERILFKVLDGLTPLEKVNNGKMKRLEEKTLCLNIGIQFFRNGMRVFKVKARM